MARIGSVKSTRESRGEISTRVEGTITGVTRCRMSIGNRGTHGSPYASQRAIQISYKKLGIRRGEKDFVLILLYIKLRSLERYLNEGGIFEQREGITSWCSLRWSSIKACHF